MAELRICNVCGKPMSSGYCIADGAMYFCSAKCLEEVFTTEEYNQLHDEGDAYWTEWESEYEPDPPETIRVGFKMPGASVQFRDISNTISALQSLVEGYVEVAGSFRKGVAILCDEEGLLKGKRPNCFGIVGNIVFIRTRGSEFVSLTDEDVLRIAEWEALEFEC